MHRFFALAERLAERERRTFALVRQWRDPVAQAAWRDDFRSLVEAVSGMPVIRAEWSLVVRTYSELNRELLRKDSPSLPAAHTYALVQAHGDALLNLHDKCLQLAAERA